MIYTITLNPALDQYMEVERLRLDDANRLRSECLFAGGKGIDVSRAIRHLGGDSMALGFIGGHNGRIITDLLKREWVTSYFTPIARETRRNVIISATGEGTQTILNAAGPSVTAGEWRAFLAHLRLLDLRDAYVVMGGSLPRGLPADTYERLIRLVQGRGARAVLDADGAALRAGLRARPFAVKPNVNELRRAVGRPLRTTAEVLAAAASLHRRGVAVVIVSRGRRGLLVVGEDGRGGPTVVLRAVPPAVTVRSTVGAGDSTVAGFVIKLAGGKTLEEAVRYATAAGTAATLAPGNQLCRLADVQRLAPRVRVAEMEC